MEQSLSYKKTGFQQTPPLGMHFITHSLAMNKNLHAALKKLHRRRRPATVSTAEMQHPSVNHAHIQMVSINIHQSLRNISGCHFFHMVGFSYTPLLHMLFHVRCHSVRLLLCCHVSHSNKI